MRECCAMFTFRLRCVRLKTRLRLACYVLIAITLVAIFAFLLRIITHRRKPLYFKKRSQLNASRKGVSDDLLAIANENNRRLENIKEACSSVDYHDNLLVNVDWERLYNEKVIPDKTPFWWKQHLHVDEKHKLLYCHVPKAVSRTFLRYLVRLSDPTLSDTYIDNLQVHNTSFQSPFIKSLAAYPFEEAMEKLVMYPKVSWVRNPLDRLVSAWKDKLSRENPYFNKRYGRFIVKYIRRNYTKEDLERGYPISLQEFFQFLLEYPRASRMHDSHWKPMHEVCLFCAIRYDFVGKIETFDREIEFLAKRILKIQELPPLPASPPFYKDKHSDVRTVPQALVEHVLDLYRLDYEFFGYNATSDLEAIYGSLAFS